MPQPVHSQPMNFFSRLFHQLRSRPTKLLAKIKLIMYESIEAVDLFDENYKEMFCFSIFFSSLINSNKKYTYIEWIFISFVFLYVSYSNSKTAHRIIRYDLDILVGFCCCCFWDLSILR